ncbi:MAG: ABC transporter ATP-binding protein [Myxococcales bacterium]|nr:ABC transporter ATP-binding protein [Myxococcales bacterium]
MSVTVRNLTKRFTASAGSPRAPAVADASFEAPDGAITTLLGPSGSGKTTVLRAIAGLEQPDSGTILLDGVDCTAIPARRRGVGFVFQGYALFAHMSVRDNIAFGLQVRKMPRKEIAERVDELLSLVQLEGLGARYPKQLSGGQQQRVAFARALATRPRVLLLDEPFGALDAQVRVELRSWLQRLHAQTHVTTLLVTHDQEEALELSQHVVLMRAGRIEQVGTPHDLYDHPSTPFVASFIGGATVLRGRVEGTRAAIGPLSVAAPDGALEGAGLQAFVRPHDVRIARATDQSAVSLGKIEKLVRVGGFVKVELRLPSGEAMTVQMAKTELDALGVAEGDRVLVDLLAAKVFVEDYSI